MIRKFIPILVIVLLLATAFYFFGVPALDILGNEGYETQSKTVYDHFTGNKNYELIRPPDRKGFITSYIPGELSETISIQGKIDYKGGSLAVAKKYKYEVYFRENAYQDWELVASPSYKVSWITSKPKVENFDVPAQDTPVYAPIYSFNIIGSKEGAIRVVFKVYFDPNGLNPFDKWVWKTLATDQAYIFSGQCGMWLPKDKNGTPISTFEIGETVHIKVETGAGTKDVVEGWTNEKAWMVTLRKPDGTEYKGQNFPRYLPGHFRGDVIFTVYDDMFTPGGNNRWTIELWNRLLPKGKLQWRAIDFRAKAPGKVTITTQPELKVKTGNTVTVTLQATQNTQTQLPIEYFGVEVWYGKSNELAPGSWTDARWILHETTIDATDYGSGVYKTTFTFTPTKKGWVTILSYAHDTGGRDSPSTTAYSLYVYEEDETPPSDNEVIDEGGGQTDYGGGSSSETWLWWIDSGGSSSDKTGYAKILWFVIGFIILITCIILGLLVPLPYEPYSRLLITLLGFILAFYVWLFM